ncbi:MAG TPA: hypothetical protein VG937_19640 [Polyangiaceae bacterium]|nr:hypothetical protein [Polyangiaceae bacterium]
MPRQTAASATATSDDDFEYPAQLSILRRAIAELPVLSDAANMAACADELNRFCGLAELLVSSLARAESCRQDAGLRRAASAALLALYQVRERLDALSTKRASRATVEAIRRALYAALAALSERLAPLDGISEAAARSLTELDRALAMRLLVSDFHSTMLATSRGRSNKGWSLVVAEAELAIVLRRPAFALGPEAEKQKLSAISSRVVGYRAGKPGALTRSRVQAEVLGTSALLVALSQRVDVKRHDARSLTALGALLSGRRLDLTVAANAAELLAGLRGMDVELDRLMLELPFEPSRALSHIAHRVGNLRQRLLAS